jgi:hypothetical protein
MGVWPLHESGGLARAPGVRCKGRAWAWARVRRVFRVCGKLCWGFCECDRWWGSDGGRWDGSVVSLICDVCLCDLHGILYACVVLRWKAECEDVMTGRMTLQQPHCSLTLPTPIFLVIFIATTLPPPPKKQHTPSTPRTTFSIRQTLHSISRTLSRHSACPRIRGSGRATKLPF